jgi:hypothetical protein
MQFVEPADARKGQYLAQARRKKEIIEIGNQLEKVIKRSSYKCHIVATYVLGNPAKGHSVSWQIFLFKG